MKIQLLLVLAFLANICHGQTIFRNQNIGFTIEQPENWILAKEGLSNENLKNNIKLDEKLIAKLLADNKGSVQVVTFYKYPVETSVGVIPTVKIILRKNPFTTPESFKEGIGQSFLSMKKVFPDFAMVNEMTDIEVNKQKFIKATGAYTIKSKAGLEKVKFSVLASTIGDQFYQITFMDTEKDDNSLLFEKLINTIIIE